MIKLASLLALLYSSSSLAFTLSVSNGAYFKNNTIKVNVADNCSNLAMSPSALLALSAEAVEQFWNKVPTSRLRIEQGAVLTVSGDFRTAPICSSTNPCIPNPSLVHTKEILIACNTNAVNFSSSSILALTLPNNVSGKNIISATLLINDSAANKFKDKSRPEQISILAHEIGHAIGLGHSPVTDSLMYFETIASRYRLGWDDIDGATYLYPTEQPISGCGTVDLTGPSGNQLGPMLLGFSCIMLLSFAFRKKVY